MPILFGEEVGGDTYRTVSKVYSKLYSYDQGSMPSTGEPIPSTGWLRREVADGHGAHSLGKGLLHRMVSAILGEPVNRNNMDVSVGFLGDESIEGDFRVFTLFTPETYRRWPTPTARLWVGISTRDDTEVVDIWHGTRAELMANLARAYRGDWDHAI